MKLPLNGVRGPMNSKAETTTEVGGLVIAKKIVDHYLRSPYAEEFVFEKAASPGDCPLANRGRRKAKVGDIAIQSSATDQGRGRSLVFEAPVRRCDVLPAAGLYGQPDFFGFHRFAFAAVLHPTADLGDGSMRFASTPKRVQTDRPQSHRSGNADLDAAARHAVHFM